MSDRGGSSPLIRTKKLNFLFLLIQLNSLNVKFKQQRVLSMLDGCKQLWTNQTNCAIIKTCERKLKLVK